MTTPALPHSAWAQTHSGHAFDFLNPTPDMVRDGDVARGLSQINHFTGQLTRPYSVAQHSLLALQLLVDQGQVDPTILLQGLAHDAQEFVTNDISAPLKALLPDYQAIEARVWTVCARHFGVPVTLNHQVKAADALACRLEAHTHYQAAPLHGWARTNPQGQISGRALVHVPA